MIACALQVCGQAALPRASQGAWDIRASLDCGGGGILLIFYALVQVAKGFTGMPGSRWAWTATSHFIKSIHFLR
jgi:hypothetical protein